MDHMCNQLNKTVGIVCFSMMLHFGANAQNAASPASQSGSSQENLGKSSTASSNPSSSLNTDLNKLALDSGANNKAKGDDNLKLGTEPTISIPKVSPKNPVLSFSVAARASKTDPSTFAVPNLEILGEPESFQATAYALKGRTRTGAQVRRGVIAADPRVLPLGSVVQLRAGKYSGVYTVHDTGKRIKGKIIDVWVPDRHEARQFGRRKIQLHVLRVGPKGRGK